MANENRREFLQKAFWIFASLPVAGVALSACTKSETPSAPSGGTTTTSNQPPAGGKQPVSESDPVAASLGYVHDASKVDTNKWPKRKGPEGAKQFCSNCQFYTGVNDQWGNCQIIQAGLVAKNGWCNSWAPKPGATT